MTQSEIKLALVVDPLCLSRSEDPILVLGRVVEVPPELSRLERAAVSLTFEIPIDPDQLTQDMEQSPCLIGISEDQMATLDQTPSSSTVSGVNDPLARNQAHLDFVNYSKSINLQNRITTPVVVAVVDSGIDEDHPDFQGRLWNDGRGNHGKNIFENSHTIGDTSGSHGTHVAGLIAARQNNSTGTAGLNGDFVRIMTVKVFRGRNTAVSYVYNGVRYAIENGADVINLSLGSDTSVILEQATMEAINAGIVVITSAGNRGERITFDNCPSPACLSRVTHGALMVASVDTSTGNLSDFSNFSSDFVEIAAPGSEGPYLGLLSTVDGGSWDRKQGTSMASPVVAAAAAFLIGYLKTNNVTYTPASVETFLKDKGSRKSSFIQSSVQEGRVIDFGLISQNLEDLFQNSNNNNPGCL